MTDVEEMVAWLRVQLDEDERVARAAGGRFAGGHVWMVTDAERHPGLTGDQLGNVVTYGVPDGTLREHAAHIARHDPDSVLRDVAIKRQIIADCHDPLQHWTDLLPSVRRTFERILCRLAEGYDESPGDREEWRP